MNRDELDIIRAIVEAAYRPDNTDYVNWNYVKSCEAILEKHDKEKEDSCHIQTQQ